MYIQHTYTQVGKCHCYYGYKGDNCETYSVCGEGGSPCNHGHCETSADGEPVCVCDHGYSGISCDQPSGKLRGREGGM